MSTLKPNLMKILIKCLLGIFALMSASSCSSAKSVKEAPSVASERAYFILTPSQIASRPTEMKLYLPADVWKGTGEVQLDSVYFRGRKAELLRNEENEKMYVATFVLPQRERDFIMSSDPRDEYANKVPPIEKMAFDLKPDEALIIYSGRGETGHFRVHGIIEREIEERTIKKPENLRH